MKTIKWFLLVPGMFLLGGCEIDDPYQNVDNTRYVAYDEFDYETPVADRYIFDLSAINGKVEVIGIPGARSVRIWGEKSVGSESDDDANDHLDDLQVRVVTDADRVSVRTQQPENTHGRNYRVDYTVRIPADWDVVISQVNGEAYIDNLTAATSIDLVNGDVILRSLYGSLTTNVTNGEVDAEMALAPGGRCDLSTVNGRIALTVPKTTSASVNLSLSTGSISVYNLDLQDENRTRRTLKGVLGDGKGEILLQTINGSITLSGE